MKKHRLIAIATLAFMTLWACGQKADNPSSASPNKTSKQEASKKTSKKVSSSKTTTEKSQTEASSSVSASNQSDESTALAADSGKTSQTTSSPQNKEATGANSSSATPSSHNGTYFSVVGKYGDEIIIVNKRHPLPASYAPGENPTALAAFQQLQADMIAQGFGISYDYSGYRSFETQAGLYQTYVNRDGQAEADRYSARAGYSEHQTGLAFDLIDSYGQLLIEPQASAWVRDHAHDYGFVVRYLPGKEHITGYMPESWHIRYIGQEAKDIYRSGLTLEEYYGVEGGEYLD